MHSFKNPLSEIFLHRRILFSTTYQEIKKKYAGSVLGMLWIILYPVLFLGVYSLVYALVLKVSYPGLTTLEYICVIFSGLLIYLGFSEAIVAGNSSVVANSGLIKNTMFPIELIPVRTVLCSQLTQGAGLFILVCTLLFMNKVTYTTPIIILVWGFEILMELGIVWFLSSLNVIIRDLGNIIGIVMMLLMMASPIAYPVSMIPKSLSGIMSVNPIYSFVVASQQLLVFGEFPAMNIILTIIGWGVIAPFLGYHFFIKMKGVFVDNV